MNLQVYNSLTRKKESFEPIASPFVGMYVCGPTVYGDAHLGHARAAVTFDIIYRYLKYLGYKVRYVRNITDVGHLEHDADEGEDKIQKKAKLEQVEPMEVVKTYTARYHAALNKLNTLSPDIEPSASGHIPEQIKLVEEILKNGYAYVQDGSVYFDVKKYDQENGYGKLSGRDVEEMLSGTRQLAGQDEKRSSLDFALWKKASPEHIMRWESPWSVGFPGWHLECSAMSTKYLGKKFDIHGGGLDLLFPHHECEVAQCQGAYHTEQAKYWLHNNMITIKGQKMGKSLGNFITLDQLFEGDSDVLERAYSPMTIRFFILQAHYRSTLDFSNEALTAASKGYKKLINGLRVIKGLEYKQDEAAEKNEKAEKQIMDGCEQVFAGLNDDFNTAVCISALFNLLKKINSFYTGNLSVSAVSEEAFNKLKSTFIDVTENVLGLTEEQNINPDTFIRGLLDIYRNAKQAKEYDTVDQIREYFKKEGLVIKDMKSGIDWGYEE